MVHSDSILLAFDKASFASSFGSLSRTISIASVLRPALQFHLEFAFQQDVCTFLFSISLLLLLFAFEFRPSSEVWVQAS